MLRAVNTHLFFDSDEARTEWLVRTEMLSTTGEFPLNSGEIFIMADPLTFSRGIF